MTNGACRFCYQLLRLRQDGTVRKHTHGGRHVCRGSRLPPADGPEPGASHLAARLVDLPTVSVRGVAMVTVEDLMSVIEAMADA